MKTQKKDVEYAILFDDTVYIPPKDKMPKFDAATEERLAKIDAELDAYFKAKYNL